MLWTAQIKLDTALKDMKHAVWLSWNFTETLNTCQVYVVRNTVCLEEQLIHL